jgi:hypothetical protein
VTTDIRIPDGITALGPEATQRLEALITAAERRQADEADRALDTALTVVPRFARPIVRKVLLG